MKIHLLLFFMTFFLTTLSAETNIDNIIDISVSSETDAVAQMGDSADDPVIWYNKEYPNESRIVATDKKSGIIVYNLKGEKISEVKGNPYNNVDIIENYPFYDKRGPLVVASSKFPPAISFFKFDADYQKLIKVRQPLPTHSKSYGLCVYQNDQNNIYYAFVTGKDGITEQWQIAPSLTNEIHPTLIRTLHFKTQTEGCTTDSYYNKVYFAEEDFGLWSLDLNLSNDNFATPHLIYAINNVPFLAPDLEGIDVYKGPNGRGYIIVSVQGRSEFAVLDRRPPHNYVKSFRLTQTSDNKIDGVSNTDGLAINSSLDLLVVQDDENTNENSDILPQNFKLVSMKDVIEGLEQEQVDAQE